MGVGCGREVKSANPWTSGKCVFDIGSWFQPSNLSPQTRCSCESGERGPLYFQFALPFLGQGLCKACPGGWSPARACPLAPRKPPIAGGGKGVKSSWDGPSPAQEHSLGVYCGLRKLSGLQITPSLSRLVLWVPGLSWAGLASAWGVCAASNRWGAGAWGHLEALMLQWPHPAPPSVSGPPSARGISMRPSTALSAGLLTRWPGLPGEQKQELPGLQRAHMALPPQGGPAWP